MLRTALIAVVVAAVATAGTTDSASSGFPAGSAPRDVENIVLHFLDG
jgi:hypothetical protein